jgi:hypothetical protein
VSIETSSKEAVLPKRLAADAAGHERHVDLGRPFGPRPLDERQVALVDLPLAQQRVQHAQGAATLGEQQAARGVAIEPVSQLEVLALGPQEAQRLDAPEADAATAMNGEPGRLVEHQQPRVLIDDALGEPFQTVRRGERLGGGADPDRRHANLVAGLQPVARIGAPRVDAHLPGADEPIDMAAGNALQLAEQIVVEPLPRPLRVDLAVPHGRRAGPAGSGFLRWIQWGTN